MTAVLPAAAARTAAPAGSSEGVWHAAWRRLRRDRVGMASLAVVLVFVLLIVLTATGVVAKGWQREVGVPSAPPTLLGPAAPAADAGAAVAASSSPPVDISAIENLLHRVSRLTLDLEEVVRLDLRSVLVSAQGACVLDTRVRIAPNEKPRQDTPARRLT